MQRPARSITTTVAAVERLTHQIVDAPVAWPGVTGSLICVVAVRTVIELLLDRNHSVLYYGGTYLDLLSYASAYLSWISTALMLGLIVRFFLRLDLLQTGRLLTVLLTVTWIVPPLNWISTGGKGSGVYYASDFSDLGFNLLRLFDPRVAIAMAPAGVRVEIFLVTLVSLVLTPFAFRIRFRRAVALAATVYLSIFVLGYLPAFYQTLTGWLPPPFRWTVELPVDYFLIYIPLLPLLLGWLLAVLAHERTLRADTIVWLAYPSRLGFYLFLTIFGFAHAASTGGAAEGATAPRLLLMMVSTLLSVALLFAWAKIENDVSDLEIDAISNPRRPLVMRTLDPSAALANSRILLFGSFLLIVPAGPNAIPIWLFIAAISHLYSAPPLRLRRLYPVAHLTLAAIGTGVFALGASLVEGDGLYRYLTASVLPVSIFGAFFFLCHLKDLKDVEGDPAGGVHNVFSASRSRRLLAIACLVGFTACIAGVMKVLNLTHMPAALLVGAFLVGSVRWISRLEDLKTAERLFSAVYALVALLSLFWLAGLASAHPDRFASAERQPVTGAVFTAPR